MWGSANIRSPSYDPGVSGWFGCSFFELRHQPNSFFLFWIWDLPVVLYLAILPPCIIVRYIFSSMVVICMEVAVFASVTLICWCEHLSRPCNSILEFFHCQHRIRWGNAWNILWYMSIRPHFDHLGQISIGYSIWFIPVPSYVWSFNPIRSVVSIRSLWWLFRTVYVF